MSANAEMFTFGRPGELVAVSAQQVTILSVRKHGEDDRIASAFLVHLTHYFRQFMHRTHHLLYVEAFLSSDLFHLTITVQLLAT